MQLFTGCRSSVMLPSASTGWAPSVPLIATLLMARRGCHTTNMYARMHRSSALDNTNRYA
eukprot:6584493-Lingulodinium_polyedra.AAC.1